MSMKNKLRRAFDLHKPDVLGSILDDCPAPEKIVARKPKRKLSDRAKEFIATAAALALIISAVGGGFVYYRDYFSSTSPDRSDSPGTTPPNATTPPDLNKPNIDPTLPQATAPLPTVDFDNSVEGLIMRTDDMIYPLAMRDSIYQIPDVPVELIDEDGIEKYLIRRTDNGYCYEFKFRPSNGELLSIDIIPCDCIKEGSISPYLATWIALMDLAPQHYSLTQYCEYNWQTSDDGAYLIQVWYLEEYTYVIDAHTGEILDHYLYQPKETISYLTARDIALELWGFTVNDVKILKLAEDGTTYTVYFECGEFAYTVYLDAITGSVLYDSGSEYIGLRANEQMEHLIGWVKARDLCLDDCGRSVDEMIGFTWEYSPGDPDWYSIELYFPAEGFSYRVDALDGNFLDRTIVDPEPPDGRISTDTATLIALHKAGLTEDYFAGAVEELACKFDDRDPENKCYWIYFKARGISYEVAVHAYTGEVLSLRAFGNSEFYTKEDAIQKALGFNHCSEDDCSYIECIQLGTKNDRTIYLVIFDRLVYTMVDANTLRIMDVDNPFPADAIDQKIAVQNSLSLVGIDSRDEPVLVMQGVFNDGHPLYCIYYCGTDLWYFALVDAYSGEVLGYQVQEAPLGIENDLDLQIALTHTGFTLEEVTDLSCEHDTSSDSVIRLTRIYFTVGNVRYEVVVATTLTLDRELLEVNTTELE